MSALHRGDTTINHCFEEAFVTLVVSYREMVDRQSRNDRMHVFYQDMDPHLRNFHTGCIAWTGPDEMAEDLDGIIGTMFIMFRYQMDASSSSCLRVVSSFFMSISPFLLLHSAPPDKQVFAVVMPERCRLIVVLFLHSKIHGTYRIWSPMMDGFVSAGQSQTSFEFRGSYSNNSCSC